jgi:poly(hydroxyalkanoate) depolymerase family esterase
MIKSHINLVGAALVLLASYGARSQEIPLSTPDQPTDSFQRYEFTNEAGTLEYMLYVPPGPPRSNRPLVVFMPGAFASAEQTAHDTELNILAAREGFLVLYPEADERHDGTFHPNDPAHQRRDQGEPAIIAGMTRKVIGDWHVDPRRVLAGGISNGAAMANVMITAYPDVYASVFPHSGCAYDGQCNAIFGSSMTAEHSALAIRKEMGDRARVVPFIVFHGADDRVVPPDLSARTVASWLQANDFADDGVDNGSIPRDPAFVAQEMVPGGHPYSVAHYVDGQGCPLGEYWLVQGMRHAYSGGAPNTVPGIGVDPDSDRVLSPSGTDPAGPDASEAAWRFLLAHPLGLRARDC